MNMKIDIIRPTVCGGVVVHLERDDKTGNLKPKKGVECSRADASLLMKLGKAEPADKAAEALLAKINKEGGTDALIEGK